MLGVGIEIDGFPLFYDAENSKGLYMAALNFPGLAVYERGKEDLHGVASFELITFLLSRCNDLREARELLKQISITDDNFSERIEASPLHWIIADKSGSAVLECTACGTRIYENPYGILTNAPPFPYHEWHITDYLHLSSEPQNNFLSERVKAEPYSRGMGAIGLPGDYSSASRFVRAFFVREKTDPPTDKYEAVNRFFHIAGSVAVPKGCIKTSEGKSVYTVYTALADLDSMGYYFTTYDSGKIRFFAPREKEKNGDELVTCPISCNLFSVLD